MNTRSDAVTLLAMVEFAGAAVKIRADFDEAHHGATIRTV